MNKNYKFNFKYKNDIEIKTIVLEILKKMINKELRGLNEWESAL